MRGKLIVIDGVDGSGKETQVNKLCAQLKDAGHRVMKVSFPDYESDSSALVKMYLRGDFGMDANSVDPYVASSFYAADRYASYKTKWGKFLDEGGIVICDRYVSSNMIHQGAKIKNFGNKDIFLEWLEELEFDIYKIPHPDAYIFLDMPPQYTQTLMASRKNKITGEDARDIHESDPLHLTDAYHNALYVAVKYRWNRIDCIRDGEVRTIDSINVEIANIVEGII